MKETLRDPNRFRVSGSPGPDSPLFVTPGVTQGGIAVLVGLPGIEPAGGAAQSPGGEMARARRGSDTKVELPGIEPGSLNAGIGLLRA